MPAYFSIKAVERTFQVIELGVVFLVLWMAFGLQFLLKEIPCPLCMLQRIGLLGMAFGYILNLRFGLRPSHYAITLLSGLFASFVALRQIALHVVPGTGSYGQAIFGFHLYTWSFIISMMIVVTTIFMLSMDRQYQKRQSSGVVLKLAHLCIAILLFLTLANFLSVMMTCGLSACPENPIHYLIG